MKAISHRNEDRAKAWTISLLLHALLLLLLLIWRITDEKPLTESPPIVLDWGGGGSDVAAGTDQGQGDEPAPEGEQMEMEAIEQPVDNPTPTPPTPAPSQPATNNAPQTNSPTTEDPNVAAMRKAQEEARRRQQQEEQRRLEEARAEAERQRLEQEERERKKGKFGSAFGSGNGGGQGNTGSSGNQGKAEGSGDNPFGQGAGTGGGTGGGSGTGTGSSVGGGLSGRKLLSRPRMVDDSQKTGKVNISVCVDSQGNVTTASYTQRGSTTSDAELRNKAIKWAKEHKFGPSSVSKECGNILFNFQLQ